MKRTLKVALLGALLGLLAAMAVAKGLAIQSRYGMPAGSHSPHEAPEEAGGQEKH